MAEQIGIVLDVQQLFTQTAGRPPDTRRFLDSLDEIPAIAVRTFHIHRLHGVPCLDDPIPWREVFYRIHKLKSGIVINPEVSHTNGIGKAIAFCRGLLDGAS